MTSRNDSGLAFISYCRQDLVFVLKLAEDLRAQGARVWLDRTELIAGQPWDRAIEDALVSCPTLLVILSPAAVASDNVMNEVTFALEEGKPVIPILYRDCRIPLRLRRFHYADFRSDYRRGMFELIRTLDIPTSQTPLVHAATPELKQSRWCSACGSLVDVGADWCNKCGKQVFAFGGSDTGRQCASCGEMGPSLSSFCVWCGEMQQEK